MSSEHTPGPWKADGLQIFIDDDVAPLVAVVADEKHHVEVAPERAKADARLIAAAPELLEACENLLDWITESFPDLADQPFDVKQARTAIAKARGE